MQLCHWKEFPYKRVNIDNIDTIISIRPYSYFDYVGLPITLPIVSLSNVKF